MTRPRGRSERAGRGPSGPAGTRPGGTPPPSTNGRSLLQLLGCASTVAVVLGLPLLLAGMWSYRPDLGRPLTLAALLLAVFARHLISPAGFRRTRSATRRPGTTVPQSISARDTKNAGRPAEATR